MACSISCTYRWPNGTHVNIWGWTDGEASLMMYGFFTSTHQSDVCSGVCAHSFKLDRIKEGGSTLVPSPMPALCHLKYRKVGRAWYLYEVKIEKLERS